MARHGILLFTFSLILLAVKQVSEAPILLIPPSIPPPPVCFSTALRIILIVISLIFTIAFFWIWRKYKLANLLKGWLKKVAYSIIFLLLVFILWLIPPIPAAPVCFFTTIGIIALLTSLAFMVAVFCKWLSGKLENLLEGQFQYTYWTIFWLVYVLGWLKGLSSIPTEGFAFRIVYWIGFAWFFVIPIIMLRATWQAGKRK